MAESLRKQFSGKKVLITGGLGFIGSTLARRLVAWKARVVLVDSLIPEYGGNLFNIHGIEKKVTVNIADVRDEFGMASLIQGQDYLFNLAGQNSHWDSMVNPLTDLEINCKSQLSILEACRKKNRGIKIVYASTRQVYGKPRYLPVDENHPICPTDVNGIHKAAGEAYHMLYHAVHGIRTSALRLTNTYGPRMRVKDARQTFVGWWIRRVLDGEKLQVYGDGRQLRDFNYVDDAVEALLLAAARRESEGRVWNLGGVEPVALMDLARLFARLNPGTRISRIPFPAGRKKIDIGDYYGDFQKIRRELGWRPRVSLLEGLKKTFSYYRRHRRHYF